MNRGLIAKPFNLLVMPCVSSIRQVVDKFPQPINLTEGSFKNLEFIFTESGAKILHLGVDLKVFSFVWLSSSWRSRDVAYAIKLYLNKHKIPHTYVEKGTSKLTDRMIFANHNIQAPNTVFVDHIETRETLSMLAKVCKYPLIIKDIKGSRGMHSEYIACESELLEKLDKLPKYKRYLFQTYIENEYDWGIMVANGSVVSGEKSYPRAGEFRNNTCNGASEVFVRAQDIPDNIKEMALKASKALGLSWSRTDIIIDKTTQKPFILEVNRLPGISAMTSEVDGAYAFLSGQFELLKNHAVKP